MGRAKDSYLGLQLTWVEGSRLAWASLCGALDRAWVADWAKRFSLVCRALEIYVEGEFNL